MTSETIIALAEQSITTVLLTAGPLLVVALATGLAVSVFQATTQIQEQTLAFVPKIVAVLIGIVFFGSWMLGTVTNFATDIFENLVRYIG